MFALLGRAVHSLLEEHGRKAGLGEYVEERLFAEVNGWRISGGMDLWTPYKGKLLITDYKVTSVKGAYAKIEWERQLNMYAWLYYHNKGTKVTGLQVCAILRDWSKMKAGGYEYPEAPFKIVPIRLWDPRTTLAYIQDRIAFHAAARASDAFDDELPPCTDEERWKRGDTWAVKKAGGVRALRVFETEPEAQAMLAEKGAGHEIQHRPGVPLRCMEYCEAAPFCSQWQSEKDQYK